MAYDSTILPPLFDTMNNEPATFIYDPATVVIAEMVGPLDCLEVVYEKRDEEEEVEQEKVSIEDSNMLLLYDLEYQTHDRRPELVVNPFHWNEERECWSNLRKKGFHHEMIAVCVHDIPDSGQVQKFLKEYNYCYVVFICLGFEINYFATEQIAGPEFNHRFRKAVSHHMNGSSFTCMIAKHGQFWDNCVIQKKKSYLNFVNFKENAK